jgi:hypothetical protein
MTPVKETLLAAIAGALAGVVGADLVFREDPNPDQAGALVVREEGEAAVDESNFGLEFHSMSVIVEGVAAAAQSEVERVGAASAAATARVALEAAVRAAILANRNLGGAHDIRAEGALPAQDLAAGHPRQGAFSLGFTVEWFTPTGDPYTFGA